MNERITMDEDELTLEIGALLRGLRSCDSQPTAVAWMTRAYKAMERCLSHLEKPAQGVVFLPTRPKLEVVQSLPKFDLEQAKARRYELQQRSISQIVVYPETFLHRGLKVTPRAWTREDTLRLERAAKLKQGVIQKRGR